MLRQVFARPARAWASGTIRNSVQSGERVTLYNVRLRPGMSLQSKFALYTIVGIGSYLAWIQILEIASQGLEHIPPPTAKEQEEDANQPLFLPFPFTDKQVNPLPYAGAEEEWQEFIKFNKNPELKKRVKDELNMLVKTTAERSPLIKRWGKNGATFTLGPSWLIMSFPERPPPEWVRTGLELSVDGKLSIKERKLDSQSKAIIDRVLMPYPLASATYAYAKTMATTGASGVAKYFGLESGGAKINTSNPDPDIEKTLKKLQERQTAGGSSTASPSTSSSTPSTTTTTPQASESSTTQTPTPQTPTPTTQTNTPQNSPPAQPDSSSIRKKLDPEPLVKPGSLAAKTLSYSHAVTGPGPWMAFKEAYAKTWKPIKATPPRGALAIHGLVALESPKGRVYIDVFAWYHPKTNTFHHESMTMALKSIVPFNQKPRR